MRHFLLSFVDVFLHKLEQKGLCRLHRTIRRFGQNRI